MPKKYTMLTNRWQGAMIQLKKLRFIAASVASKVRTIRANFLGLFYGTEANDPNERQLAAAAAAVIDVFAARNDHHDGDLFLR